ncbi:MAG: hypothetical protein NZ742_00350 [Acidobacteria bacterium]|nr:hypothetical protein [Acidobacteriota bacterium]MDW7983236.1 hypothetical protein [Acidobacteriota bacterium]
MGGIAILILGLPVVVEAQPERAFGYWVGDLLVVEARVRVSSGHRLDRSSLHEGDLPEWLELRSVHRTYRGGIHRIRWTYQVFLSPLDVIPVQIPGRTLRFQGPEGTYSVEVPPVTVYLSPLAGSGAEPTLEFVPPQPSRRAVYGHGGVLAGLIGGWTALWAWRRRRRPRLFRAVVRRVRETQDPTEALTRLWEALEAKAGTALFPHDLDRLLQRWPPAGRLRPDLAWLFELREVTFYRPDPDPEDGSEVLARIRRLVQDLDRLERRSWSSRDPTG